MGYFLKHPTWGWLMSDPRSVGPVRWSAFFPAEVPERFEYEETAYRVRRMWDSSVDIRVVPSVQMRLPLEVSR